MYTSRLSALALSLAMTAPVSVLAGEFDGSSPMLCALSEVMECAPGQDCQRILPEEVGAPDFFLVDVTAKSVQGLGSHTRTSVIRSVTLIYEKLILQGADDGLEGVRDGLGWSAAIAQDSGRFVLSASGDRVAFVVFGACAALVGVKVLPD
ncbi:MAG: hypothetical protein ACFCUW_15615 [Kiloniellaceae bacterium]